MTYIVSAPGLRQFAQEEGLTPGAIKQLDQAWDTIRGHRPRTVEEWRAFYAAVKDYIRDDYGSGEVTP